MSLRTLVLGLLGLALAGVLGVAGYAVARDTFALPATSLPAGGRLAPPVTSRQAAPQPSATTDERAGTATREDEEREREDEDHSGPGGGGGGNSGPGGGGSGSGSGGNSGRGGDDD